MAQLVKYGIFGGTGALSDFLVFAGLHTQLGTPAIPTNIVSILTGIGVSFLLNSRFTFAATDHRRVRALRFFTVGLTGLVVSNALIALFIGPLAMDAVPAKLITVPIIALLQFVMNRTWTFRPLASSKDRRQDGVS